MTYQAGVWINRQKAVVVHITDKSEEIRQNHVG